MSNIGIIPDTHDKPGVSKERFTWASEFMLDRQPESIVHMGDWSTIDSISSYETGTIEAEGKRYNEDIRSHIQSLEAFHKPIDEYNNKHTRWKKKKYNPRLVYCVGNHDMRIEKYVHERPELKNSMGLRDMKFEEFGWEVYPLTTPANIDGIAFSHFFTSGIMGKPISGIHHAHSLIVKGLNSCVVGHTHLRDFHEMTNVFGQQIFGLSTGCYYEHGDHYTTEGKRMWRGLTYLTVEDRVTNPEFISLNKIKELYS